MIINLARSMAVGDSAFLEERALWRVRAEERG
jgi:hypothetical protein